MNKKDTILRILIVVGVLYTALMVVIIILFSLTLNVLSGLRISYENLNDRKQTEDESTLPADMDPSSYPVSYLEAI